MDCSRTKYTHSKKNDKSTLKVWMNEIILDGNNAIIRTAVTYDCNQFWRAYCQIWPETLFAVQENIAIRFTVIRPNCLIRTEALAPCMEDEARMKITGLWLLLCLFEVTSARPSWNILFSFLFFFLYVFPIKAWQWKCDRTSTGRRLQKNWTLNPTAGTVCFPVAYTFFNRWGSTVLF